MVRPMCRRYRCLLFLMLLWLPVKGVLSAAMPFPAMAAQSAGSEVAHCHMQAANMQAMPESGEAAPLSHAGHDASGHGGYGQSITCHGLCAVFLAADFVFPLTAEAVDAPPASRVAFHSHIPAFPDRPPLL